MFNIHELIILTRGICIRRFPIGAIQYLPVTSLLEWEIPVKGIKFANKIITPPTRFIVDTGTTVNIIPEKYAEILFAEIPGSGIDNETGLRTVPCDIDETFTTSFIIGNEEYIMPAKDLAFQRINNTNNCITGTQGGELDDQWLLGDTFIKVYIYIISHAKGLLVYFLLMINLRSCF